MSKLGKTASVLGTVAPLAFTAYQISDAVSTAKKVKEQEALDAITKAENERLRGEESAILASAKKKADEEYEETVKIKNQNDLIRQEEIRNMELQRKLDAEQLKKLEADYAKMYQQTQLDTQRAVEEQVRQLIANTIQQYSSPEPTPTPTKNTPPVPPPATTRPPSGRPPEGQRTPSVNNLTPAYTRKIINKLSGAGVKHDLSMAIQMCMKQDPKLSSRALCARLNESGIATSQATVTRRLKKLRDEGKL
jgi:hypothetical protein